MSWTSRGASTSSGGAAARTVPSSVSRVNRNVAAAEHAGELGEDGQAGRDEGLSAPVGLDGRSDHEAARPDREDRAQAADDPRRVLDRIGREQDVVVDVRPEAGAQLVHRRLVLQPDDPADRGDREAGPDAHGVARNSANSNSSSDQPAGSGALVLISPMALIVRPLNDSSRAPAYSPLSASR